MILKILILCLVFSSGVVSAGPGDMWLDEFVMGSGGSSRPMPVAATSSSVSLWDCIDDSSLNAPTALEMDSIFGEELCLHPPFPQSVGRDPLQDTLLPPPLSAFGSASAVGRIEEDMGSSYGQSAKRKHDSEEEESEESQESQESKEEEDAYEEENSFDEEKRPQRKLKKKNIITAEIQESLRTAASDKAQNDPHHKNSGKLTIAEVRTVLRDLGLITEAQSQPAAFSKTEWYAPVYSFLRRNDLLEKTPSLSRPSALITLDMKHVLRQAGALTSSGKLTLNQARASLVEGKFKTKEEVRTKEFSQALGGFLNNNKLLEITQKVHMTAQRIEVVRGAAALAEMGKLTMDQARASLVEADLMTKEEARERSFSLTLNVFLGKNNLLEKTTRLPQISITDEMKEVLPQAAALTTTGKLTMDKARAFLVAAGLRTSEEAKQKQFSKNLNRFLTRHDLLERTGSAKGQRH